MNDFVVACQRTETQGTALEASRAKLSYLVIWRLVGISAPGLAGMAICLDFNEKMEDFEVACHETETQGTRLEASRATKLLSKSSAHRYVGS